MAQTAALAIVRQGAAALREHLHTCTPFPPFAVALAIASDYESWKCLRRAIKWYNAYQRNMACYLFVVSGGAGTTLPQHQLPLAELPA